MKSYEHLKILVYEKAIKYYGDSIPKEIKERIENELNLIGEKEKEDVFLLVYDIVQYCNSRNSVVNTRGDLGSLLVTFLLGISSFNPTQKEYSIPFEYFREYRNDRDLSISLNMEHKFIEKVKEKFGNCNYFPLIRLSEYEALSELNELLRKSRIKSNEIPLDNLNIIKTTAHNISAESGIDFGVDKVNSFEDLVNLMGYIRAKLNKRIKFDSNMPYTREAVFRYLISKKFNEESACTIIDEIMFGTDEKHILMMEEKDIPVDMINHFKNLLYFFPKSHCIEQAAVRYKIEWIKNNC